jgi:adenylate kinase
MRVVLLGPPAAGKGTQAGRLVERFGGVHIDTGDILRANADRDTELGRRAKVYMERGELVPDEVVVDTVLDRVAEVDCADGFALDGFPRTVAQAEALDRHLDQLGRPLDATVSLEVGEDELWRRLAGRAREQDRADDEDEQAIRQRLELFERETEPLVDYYRRRGLLVRVDAACEIDEVSERIAGALAEHASGSAG